MGHCGLHGLRRSADHSGELGTSPDRSFSKDALTCVNVRIAG